MTEELLSNLAKTCATTSYIREDGKKLTLWNRFIDLFTRRSPEDHLALLVDNLKDKDFSVLSDKERFEIYARLTELKIGNFAANLEEAAFKGTNVEQLCTELCKKKLSAPKAELIINHYKDDTDALSKISNCLCSTSPENTDRIKKPVLKILLAKEEQFVDSDNGKTYFAHFFEYLKLANNNEVVTTLSQLDPLLERASPATIQTFLSNVQQFAGVELMHRSKRQLLAFGTLFDLVDKAIDQIDDKKLALDLKIKFANLPPTKPREEFKNLYLSPKEQLDVLVVGLQKQEDETVEALVEFLRTKNPSADEKPTLAKLVGAKSPLSPENQKKLLKVLTTHLQPTSEEPTDTIETLKRLGKCKQFFQNQIGLPDENILIPHWYHATSQWNLTGIIKAGKIEVRHEQQYRGAWVSSRREGMFGSHVLAFANRVTDIDPRAFIGRTFADHRWRGLQKPIDITNEYLAAVGVPKQSNKGAQKVEKLQIVRQLKEKGISNPAVFSIDQIDFMQRQVKDLLGLPNLPDLWWGQGKGFSEHQLELHKMMEEISVDLSDLQDEQAIGRLIQETALPAYKLPMPPDPSFQSQTAHTRITIHSSSEAKYQAHVAAIEAHTATARKAHGSMHCVRVALWTQLLARLYVQLGQPPVKNRCLLALGGAFHDIAREAEGIDYWDKDSGAVFGTFLKQSGLDEETIHTHVHALQEKDPKGDFTSDVQRIVHDADCLDIIREVGRWGFRRSALCFYHFDNSKREYLKKVIDEIATFIELTEDPKIKLKFEHDSENFYDDLVKFLFARQKQFPELCKLLKQN